MRAHTILVADDHAIVREGLNGLEALPHLKADSPSSRVVVLTMHNDAGLAPMALLGLHSTAELVRYAIEHGLIESWRDAPAPPAFARPRMMLKRIHDRLRHGRVELAVGSSCAPAAGDAMANGPRRECQPEASVRPSSLSWI